MLNQRLQRKLVKLSRPVTGATRLQNRARRFLCTRILSALVLVTHTASFIIIGCFNIVAMSMEEL